MAIESKNLITRGKLINALANMMTGEYLCKEMEITGTSFDTKKSEIFLHIDIYDPATDDISEKTIKLNLAAPVEIGDYDYDNDVFKAEFDI